MSASAEGFTRLRILSDTHFTQNLVSILFAGGCRMPLASLKSPHTEYSRRISQSTSAFQHPPGDAPVPSTLWWRTYVPSHFRLRDADTLREALDGTKIFDQPDWPAAVNGRVTTAIRIAVDTLHRQASAQREIDFAMTALLASAIDGDVCAGILISSALRQRSCRDPRCRILGDLWLVVEAGFAGK